MFTKNELKIFAFLIIMALVGLGAMFLRPRAEDNGVVLQRGVPRVAAATTAAVAPAPVPGKPFETTAKPIPKKDATGIDLNTASAEVLCRLKGVGPTLAENIIAYREKHGAFKSEKDILQVKGIGNKKLALFRAQIVLLDEK
jgi:competence ComEA-like helix-hairpin-helix protein